MVTDTIGDFIIRLKNANLAGKESVSFYVSKTKEALAETLKRTGFIKSVSKSKNGKMLEIELSYTNTKQPKINGVQRISKPSRRVYSPISKIKPFRGGFGISIISTPAGILSDKEALAKKVGGEIMFKIW